MFACGKSDEEPVQNNATEAEYIQILLLFQKNLCPKSIQFVVRVLGAVSEFEFVNYVTRRKQVLSGKSTSQRIFYRTSPSKQLNHTYSNATVANRRLA